MTDATYQFVTVPDGVRLNVATWPAAAPGGPVVLGVHGLSANHLNWAALADALGGALTLVAPDLRGRGDSDKPHGPYGMRQHADDLAALVETLGLGPVVLVGHSMGAYIAEQVVVRHPRLVSSLVIVDGGYNDVPDDIDLDALLEVVIGPSLRRLQTTHESFEAFTAPLRAMASFAGPGDWNVYTERYFAYDLAGEPPALRSKASETAVRFDFKSMADPTLRDDLAAITCPMTLLRAERGLLVTGAEPQLVSDEQVAAVRKRVPHLVDEVVASTNHYSIGLSVTGGQAIARAVRAAAG